MLLAIGGVRRWCGDPADGQQRKLGKRPKPVARGGEGAVISLSLSHLDKTSDKSPYRGVMDGKPPLKFLSYPWWMGAARDRMFTKRMRGYFGPYVDENHVMAYW